MLLFVRIYIILLYVFVISFAISLINFIPQLWFGFDIVYLITSKFPKSNLSNHNLIGQGLRLIFHFTNMLRFIEGNASITSLIVVEQRIIWYLKSVGIGILWLLVATGQIVYMMVIFAGICGIIFSLFLIILTISSFLICYASFFSTLIVITVPYIIIFKVSCQGYLTKKAMVIRTIRKCQQELSQRVNLLLQNLSLRSSTEVAGKIPIYIRINQDISLQIHPSSEELFKTDTNTNWKLSVINSCLETSIHATAITNIKFLIQGNSFAVFENSLSSATIYDTTNNWNVYLYTRNACWEIVLDCSDQRVQSASRYKMNNNKSMTIDVETTDKDFFRLSFNSNTQCLQATWKSSFNQDFDIPNNNNSDMAVEVDVPQILRDIKHVIREKLLKVVKFQEKHLEYGTYKIVIEYLKTQDTLTLSLPSCNNDYFYAKCNSELIPLITYIGGYLKAWHSNAFRQHLNSNAIYHDLSTIEDVKVVGIPKKLFDYICGPLTNLTVSWYVALAKIILVSIYYAILVIAIFAFSRIDCPATFFTTLTNTPVSLAALVVILGFITVPQYDEKKIKDGILDALFDYKRGYTLR